MANRYMNVNDVAALVRVDQNADPAGSGPITCWRLSGYVGMQWVFKARWHLHVDVFVNVTVVTAFLHGDVGGDIYMKVPAGVKDPSHPNRAT